jgi:cyclase
VKTVRFKEPRYLGDPVNAVRILNEKEVDELVFLDIAASPEGRGPDEQIIGELASECFMPLAVGGGITSVEQMRRLLRLGVEKVIVCTAAVENPPLVAAGAAELGSQSVVVALDVRRKLFGSYEVVTRCGTRRTGKEPVALAKEMEQQGAGEILVNAIDRDGTMSGYDVELTRRVADAVSVPVIACGGAGKLDDLVEVARDGNAAGVAAGSLFVYHGPHRAVLISFPSQAELARAFE